MVTAAATHVYLWVEQPQLEVLAEEHPLPVVALLGRSLVEGALATVTS